VIDWRRRERVQRCEGAEIGFDEFGHRTKGNTVDSFDMVVAGTEGADAITLYELFAADALDLDVPIEDLVIDGLDRAAIVASIREAALALLSPDERRALELVIDQGLQVVEAAAEAGVARETMGRQRDRAIAALRNAFGTLR
jgi:DNA-directed RNA polymerase specialized sigma24 family protein